MRGFCLLFTFFFLINNLQGQNTKVIIDADTGNEIDDIPAIVLALKSGKIDVLALTAAQWDRFEVCGRQTMHESWVLNNRILQTLGMENIPSLKGASEMVGKQWSLEPIRPNEASDFIIKKALEIPKGEKLVIIITGTATNVATAIKTEPKIINKIAVYFIGTTFDQKRQAINKNEFNVRNDLNAFDILLDTENLELHIMPANICTELLVIQKDIDTRLKSNDGISDMLRERWNEVNKDSTKWIMWDFAIIYAVINPQWTKQILRKTPPENTPREIFLYTEINSEAMMEDFWKVFLK
ncbi:nucleoside hydrolase [Algoriphagus sp. D3-2-R+10]|uniref:nucleoside hydrolase n=1 Tax=Algoriphagus aurantiacus TaxID=3103948 RepID=UPI002B3CF3FB|nr:nucleoside hydrolase [Algoriphagus sp. D3-2-R+10]MEB2778632.1 nucleoside hydrolase [Algoriphagus sp. D3-2-R+10]